MESRAKKRTKLEMAEAKVWELQKELAQRAPANRRAEPVACPRCQTLRESFDHAEALHKRHYNYVKRQLNESKDKAAAVAIEHQEALAEVGVKHAKEIAAMITKHKKKVAGYEHKLDHNKLNIVWLEKESKEAAVTSASTIRTLTKDLSNERKLNEELVSAAVDDKDKIAEQKGAIDKLTKEISDYKESLDEVARECDLFLHEAGEEESEARQENEADEGKPADEQAWARTALASPRYQVCLRL